jgi:hypothetical protein
MRVPQGRGSCNTGGMDLLLHLLVLFCVFGLLYWIVTLVAGVLPPPIANVARVVMLVVLALVAISLLFGEVGFYDTSWGLYRHHHW